MLAAGDVLFGALAIGLLDEARDGVHAGANLRADLDVAVPGLGTRGHDADGRHVSRAGRLERAPEHGAKSGLVGDVVVAREHHDARVGIEPRDRRRRPADARRGIARQRLGEQIRARHFGQDARGGVDEVRAGGDVHALRWDQRRDAPNRGGEERLVRVAGER